MSVSGELSSMEMQLPSPETVERMVFQENLVVWKYIWWPSPQTLLKPVSGELSSMEMISGHVGR